jgi:hypothetical protein
VPEAVARAERRVQLFQREARWRRLAEPARQELLRRRRCRVEARARCEDTRPVATLSSSSS